MNKRGWRSGSPNSAAYISEAGKIVCKLSKMILYSDGTQRMCAVTNGIQFLFICLFAGQQGAGLAALYRV